MKVARSASGAESGNVDLRIGNARFDEQPAIQLPQIDLRSPCATKLRGHLWTDLVTALADTGSDGRMHRRGARAEFIAHFRQGSLHNSARRPAPAGVYGGYRAMLFIHQQNGQAVRRLHCRQMSGFVLQHGVALPQHSRSSMCCYALIGMYLTHGDESGVSGEIGRVPRPEPVLQPHEAVERTRTVKL